MCQFIETIRIQDGELMNLPYHQKRMERTLSYLGSGWRCVLNDVLHDRPHEDGVFKARVVYEETGVKEVEYLPYKMRSIRTLKLVTCDDIDYTFKSTDRSRLIELLQLKGDADEVIIVKHGMLTDTSYSNIALFDGVKWYTPRLPLLTGTMRQSLIDRGILLEKDITTDDFSHYYKVSLINAMMPLGVCECDVMNCFE